MIIKVIFIDIEGIISVVSFVFDVLFFYVVWYLLDFVCEYVGEIEVVVQLVVVCVESGEVDVDVEWVIVIFL